MTGISKMLAFIAELRDNNNREWFAAVKPEYEAIRKECYGEIDKLINLISAFDDRLVGVATYGSRQISRRSRRISA